MASHRFLPNPFQFIIHLSSDATVSLKASLNNRQKICQHNENQSPQMGVELNFGKAAYIKHISGKGQWPK
jgi:hypothetical protein